MRLRLSIQRNALPPADTLWPIPEDQVSQKAFTIARLLDDVNRIFPLESETWGLEDYVVTVGGYECLHFAQVGHILKDEDRVCIRSLQTPEVRARTLTGRYQISEGGQHLVDGIPFGRPLLRDPNRPPVRIPPRKRRRITDEDDIAVDGEIGEKGEPSGLIPKHWKLAIVAPEEDDDEDDEDYTLDQAAQNSGSLVPAKRRKNVRFEPLPDSQELTTLPSEDEDDSEEEDHNSDQDMDTSEASEDSDDNDSDLSESDSGDSSSDESSSLSETDSSSSDDDQSDDSLPEELPSKVLSPLKAIKPVATSSVRKPVQTQRPAGQGLQNTKLRNIRRRNHLKATRLKHYGILPHDATGEDLKKLEETMTEAELKAKLRAAKLANPELASMPIQITGRRLRTEGESSSLRPSATQVQSKFKEARSHSSQESAHSKASEQQDIQSRAKALLEAIENGGIDVTPERPLSRRSGKKDTRPMPAVEVDRHTQSASGRDFDGSKGANGILEDVGNGKKMSVDNEAVEQPTTKRARLDLAGSRRLLFGSLGVRTPKSKEDEENLRKQLAAKPEPNGKAKALVEPEKDAEPSDSEDQEAWEEKINLTAFECWHEGIELSTPPFPFVQRWDPQQRLKSKGSKGKKRKRANAQYYDSGERLYGEFQQGGDRNEDLDNVQLNYDEEEDYGNASRQVQGEDIALETQLQQDMAVAASSRDDLPVPPADVSTLPKLAFDDIRKDTIIVFKLLTVGPETGWAPVVTPYRTAIVVDLDPDGRGIGLKLAQRDQPIKRTKYDHDGNRIYEKFEMAHSDTGSDSEEADWLYLQYEEMTEPKLLQQAAHSLEQLRVTKATVDGEESHGDLCMIDADVVPPSSPDMQVSPGQELHMLLESSGSHVGTSGEDGSEQGESRPSS